MTDPGASTLYVWQEFARGQWGTIAGLFLPNHPTPVPLISRNPALADAFRSIAEAHRRETGNPVRLATYVLTSTEELAP